ncbi:TIGR03668 family PPOX class F420-dependent oxidoreductase [Amycolatopsis sp. SID8362]|uniref:TIGR03668 family PPOX class F420-dependent oxidoreductase n=1 Tax=Amycolatopsis sp. SID8362 TaxID=2690346 RepID=UPI00136B8A2D|nr:TIGR03668 family PPOX class F420-dependent oxidoreductase [Amycolatopsis sp. SID8362]NBH09855.1 TIGR03668 family PPOX class F420-dependent oxidoreductase [Amycolatopsis sp. SID8362]NED46548.1 TIGR03668 family PPOX class F420-dependent oxidoreductase [Amycolatopsis sp. SID8362]
MTPEEARERFAAARVARLATVSAAGVPHLVPVTFAVRGDVVVFAVDHKPKSTTSLRRLRNIAANPAVCFLADGYSEDWSRLWWARADGTARVLPDDERAEPVSWLVEKYAQYAERPPEHAVVVTAVHTWRGWTG